MQKIYQTIAEYFQDDDADELTTDPVFTSVLGKKKHASQLSVLAYNLLNWFRRLVLPAKMRKLRMDTLRLKLIKIAARIIHLARYITFKLCSSCPYQNDFLETLRNIKNLTVKLE